MEHSNLIKEVEAKLTAARTEIGVKSIQIVDSVWDVSDQAGFPILGILDGGDSEEQTKVEDLQRLDLTFVAIQKIQTGNPGASVLGSESRPGCLKIKERTVAFLKKKENRVPGFHSVKYMGSPPAQPFDRLKVGSNNASFKLFRMRYSQLARSS
jgi:hypothetical protein